MGTVLSISPESKKAGAILDEKPTGGHAVNSKEKTEKSIKRHSVMVSALTWKRLVAASTKKKSTKKVNPNPLAPQVNNSNVEQLNNEKNKKSQLQSGSNRKTKAVPIAVPVPTVPTQNLQPSQEQVSSAEKQTNNLSLLSPRRVIIQASTGELMHCLADFLCRRCYKLKELTTGDVIFWFRNVDRTLLIQGWQDQGFITPANLVFVYLLCRDTVSDDIDSAYELQGTFLTCLYLAYSYMGNEISYPLKPFMIEANKDVFWDKSLTVINEMSAKMLQLNADPHFFTEVFQELKNEGESVANSLDR